MAIELETIKKVEIFAQHLMTVFRSSSGTYLTKTNKTEALPRES